MIIRTLRGRGGGVALARRGLATTRHSINLSSSGPRTMYDKIWDDHVVEGTSDGTALLYIDRHLVHEVTSPQAFEGLAAAGRPVRRPDCTLVTVDHNVPTFSRESFQTIESFIKEDQSRAQVVALEQNVQAFSLPYFGMADKRQGIVHIIGPEQGFTVPGSTCVCGDSHTATHGAFGALAFGIGTSEVEHVLATSTLNQKKAMNMLVQVDGTLGAGVTSKDIVLHICGVIGTAGGTGATIEFAGSAIRALSMEARMSISNMAIEAGARAGAPTAQFGAQFCGAQFGGAIRRRAIRCSNPRLPPQVPRLGRVRAAALLVGADRVLGHVGGVGAQRPVLRGGVVQHAPAVRQDRVVVRARGAELRLAVRPRVDGG